MTKLTKLINILRNYKYAGRSRIRYSELQDEMKVGDTTLIGWLETLYHTEPPVAFGPKDFQDYGWVILNPEKLEEERKKLEKELEECIDTNERNKEAVRILKTESILADEPPVEEKKDDDAMPEM